MPGGLLGAVRELRTSPETIARTPVNVRLNDSDDLVSESIEVEMSGEDTSLNDVKIIENDPVLDGKIRNLQGVRGDKNDHIATGLENSQNICYMNSVVQL